MECLTIYILCHNRPDFARQAILSVLSQTNRSFTLTVSDNSSNDDVENMIKREFPGIQYIRRAQMLNPLEHFNCCIDETRTDYFCLFHDDDVMHPIFVEEMIKCLTEFPAAIAFGCNAENEVSGRIEPRTSFRSFRKYERIASPLNLARRYFSRAQSGFAPFPGYVYNRHLIGDKRLPFESGKYADVAWLLELSKAGAIVWVNKVLMTYRIHEGNDSNAESIRDRLRFLGYLKKNRELFGEGLLKDYRSFIYKKIMSAHAGSYSARHERIVSFLNAYRWLRNFRFDYWKALVVRTLVKWVA